MKTATSYCDAAFKSISLSSDSKTLTITFEGIDSEYENTFAVQTSSDNIWFYPSGNIRRQSDNAFISQSDYYYNFSNESTF